MSAVGLPRLLAKAGAEPVYESYIVADKNSQTMALRLWVKAGLVFRLYNYVAVNVIPPTL